MTVERENFNATLLQSKGNNLCWGKMFCLILEPQRPIRLRHCKHPLLVGLNLWWHIYHILKWSKVIQLSGIETCKETLISMEINICVSTVKQTLRPQENHDTVVRHILLFHGGKNQDINLSIIILNYLLGSLQINLHF